MKRVIIESPYAGDVARNIHYLHLCALDSLTRNESPIASHGWFTLFLNDDNIQERALGIMAGLAWSEVCDYVVVYQDFGITDGMKDGIEKHKENGKEIVYRKLGETIQ